jgi:hypothetical protein
MDDLNAVTARFTEGLRDLPTDDITRVKYFLAEYLGSPQRPVPFGGRGKDFTHLDSWLADHQAPPYVLLAAPAGRGKSALLLRWCQHLFPRRDLAVVYFPVSIRFRTNLAGVVFPALVALLAKLHGENIPADSHTSEEVWRGLLSDYMARPLSDGRLLVLILDGVDEAADWVAGPDLFPADPPAGLRVVLSARYLANDSDASAWLRRLGWTRQGLAETLELYPLDRAGIASVLLQMGFPLDRLGTRVDLVTELHRLSEGDPLLVRLYVDDLWERGEASMRLSPEDLQAIRPGLAGYFERWWSDQRLLWSKEAPAYEAALQQILNLLAGALGPLSKNDMLHLAPAETGLHAENFEEHLEPLKRFVIGDGMRQGYVFSHPRLAGYFLEDQLTPEQRQAIEHCFLAWGKQTLTDLNSGTLPPEQASAYIVQYYGAHLERARAETPELLALVSDGWRRAWEKLDRANAGFLGDSERAWRAAEGDDRDASLSGQLLPYLGAEIRSLLCRTSINSMTSNISPRLMLEAVKTGVWTPAQGLASIRLIAELAARARELAGLAPYVQEPQRSDILQEALDTLLSIKDDYTRFNTLVELAPHLSEELLAQVLTIAAAIEDEADRAGILVELAPALSWHGALIEQALDITQEIEDEEYLALALAGLAPIFSTEQPGETLQLAQAITNERYQVQVFTALLPYLPAESLIEVLQATRKLWDTLAQVRLLGRLVEYLPAALQADVVRETLQLLSEIIDQEYRVEVLVSLAPSLSEDQLRSTLQEIQALWDESYRARALSDLLPHLPAADLPAFLTAVQAMKNEEQRTTLLLQLLPRLPETLVDQALSIIQTTWDEGRRAELLAKVAPLTTQDRLPRLLELISELRDPGFRVWLQAELEISLADQPAVLPFDLVQTFSAMPDPDERVQTLLAVVPRLSDEALAKIFSFMLPEIFGFRWSVHSPERRAQILAKLSPHLPKPWLIKAMSMIRTLENEAYQVQVLLALAPRVHEALLSPVLDLVRSLNERERRAQVLEALVSSLPEQERGARVREMLQVLQVIKDESQRIYALSEFASLMTGTFPVETLRMALDAVIALNVEMHQARALVALAPHVPEEMFDEMLHLIQALRGDEERVHILEALAPHVPEWKLPALLATAQTISQAQWRTRALTAIVAQTTEGVFDSVLHLVEKIDDEYERARVLAALAPHTPEGAFAQFWAAIQKMSDSRRRVWILGSLALRISDAFFPRVWAAIQEIEEEGWRLRTLGALAPHMAADAFDLLWTAVQAIGDSRQRLRAIGVLAPHVPERYYPEVFLAAWSIPDNRMRGGVWEGIAGEALEALASHVPESFFWNFWTTVSTMQDKWGRARLQVLLAARVPETYFPQLWEALLAMEDSWQQGELLEVLAFCVPDDFFPQFWAMVQSSELRGKQLSILKTLLPRLSQRWHVQVFAIAQTLPSPRERLEILEMLIPYLSAERAVELLDMLLPPQNREQYLERVEAEGEKGSRGGPALLLAKLALRLPRESLLDILPLLLRAARRVETEAERTELLATLAPCISEDTLLEVLQMFWLLESEQSSTRMLGALLSTLPPGGVATVFAQITARARETGNLDLLMQLLKVAGTLAQPQAVELLYPPLREYLHFLAQSQRREALLKLVPLAGAIRALGGEVALSAVWGSMLETGYWWP